MCGMAGGGKEKDREEEGWDIYGEQYETRSVTCDVQYSTCTFLYFRICYWNLRTLKPMKRYTYVYMYV